MSLTEMQHQYWVTKQTVLRRLGGKEDECVVASDAELDAKLELFRSISESCVQLQRVLEQYQERLCILAQEENSLGRFLKECGRSTTSGGKHMTCAGKALSYSGQQRIQLRAPLLRLQHEVETFRARAVGDTRGTLTAMERARTDYRASLNWMKAASSQLDPDTGRGLEKFRKAQTQVRLSKSRFDRLTLDCLQKVDLLAAARCNMYSHALVQYQTSILTFNNRTCQTFLATANTLKSTPHYDFCILKELTEPNNETADNSIEGIEKETQDVSDQLLFFQDEYTDLKPVSDKKDKDTSSATETCSYGDLLELSNDLLQLSAPGQPQDSRMDADLLGLDLSGVNAASFMPSQLLQDLQLLDMNQTPLLDDFLMPNTTPSSVTEKNSSNKTIDNVSENPTARPMPKAPSKQTTPTSKNKDGRKDMSAWFQLFSELDPLANPDAMPGHVVTNSHST